jgi:hypothetical protein
MKCDHFLKDTQNLAVSAEGNKNRVGDDLFGMVMSCFFAEQERRGYSQHYVVAK